MRLRHTVVLSIYCAISVGIAAATATLQDKRPAAPKIGYVTSKMPTGLAPDRNLSAKERQENFDFLCDAIQENYACFKVKSIDWKRVRLFYQKRLAAADNDDDFYLLLFQLVNELKDTHSGLQNYKFPPLADATEVSTDLFEGKPFITQIAPGSEIANAGVKPGWEILSVDGRTFAENMEAQRPFVRAFSSERAYRRHAARSLLSGPAGSDAILELRSPEGDRKQIALRRKLGPTMGPLARNSPVELTKRRYIDFGRHPSGLGYIRIRSFNGREDVVDEFDRALDQLKGTPGLILDIRDNTGGYGQPKIVGRLLKKRVLAAVAYIKNGPGEDDLEQRKSYLQPSGPWQYTRPVALLLNDVTGSAADLFACELRSAGRVLTVGTTTHGNLSGVSAFAVLPCRLVVRISNGYVADSKKRIIEVNGNPPDYPVDPTLSDFLSGKDPIMERAVELLQTFK